ncbi:hypothetical protein RSAG8_10548, partial [Rhizoctonia solani AG-8 WAC10335]
MCVLIMHTIARMKNEERRTNKSSSMELMQ